MRRLTACLVALAFVACAEKEDSPAVEIAAAADALVHTIEATKPLRVAFDILGQLPEFQPGTSRADYLKCASVQLHDRIGCAMLTTTARATDDQLVLTFPGDGCVVGQHALFGTIVFTFVGGGDCLDSQVDLGGLYLDNALLSATASHGTCTDANAWSARAAGKLKHEYTFDIAGTLIVHEGMNETIVLDGHADLGTPDGLYQVQIEKFTYTLGDFTPHHGEATFAEPGHFVRASLSRQLGFPFDRTNAEVTVDDHDPVTVPLP